MAKTSSIEKNKRRRKLAKQYRRPARASSRRSRSDKKRPMEERFAATLKLAELPRNSSPRRASAIAAKSPAGRAPITASSR